MTGQEKPFCTVKWQLQGHARKSSGHLETKLWPLKYCNSSTEHKAQLSPDIFIAHFKKGYWDRSLFEKMSHLKFHKTMWVIEMWWKDSRSLHAFPRQQPLCCMLWTSEFLSILQKAVKEMWVGNTAKQIKLMTKYIFPISNCLKNPGISRTEMQKQFPSEELKKIHLLKIHQVQWVPGLQGGQNECQHVIQTLKNCLVPRVPSLQKQPLPARHSYWCVNQVYKQPRLLLVSNPCK